MKKLVITAGTAALVSMGAFLLPATAQADVSVSVKTFAIFIPRSMLSAAACCC